MGSGPASGRTIVAAQVAVSVLLLASATLFVRGLYGVLSTSAGVDRQVLVLTADAEAGGYEDERAATYYQQLLERCAACQALRPRAFRSIRRSAAATAPGRRTSASTAGSGADASVGISTPSSSDYFRTTGMTLLRGRDIAETDNVGRAGCGGERALVRRFFPWTGSLGRQITIGRGENRQTCKSSAWSPTPSISGSRRSRAASRICRGPSGGREHVPRAAPRSPAAVGGSPPRSAQHRRVVPVCLQTVGERIREALVTELLGNTCGAPRCSQRRRRAQDSTGCWLTPSPARPARSACGWPSGFRAR